MLRLGCRVGRGALHRDWLRRPVGDRLGHLLGGIGGHERSRFLVLAGERLAFFLLGLLLLLPVHVVGGPPKRLQDILHLARELADGFQQPARPRGELLCRIL
jgi:hypothetical protein